MRIALVGYGKMGRMIEEVALQRGHEIVAIIDGSKAITAESLASAEVAIDFSHPEAVVDNIRCLSELGKNMVVGTSGWDAHLSLVTEMVSKSGVGVIYGSNFSVGVHLFYQIVRYAVGLVNRFDAYDVALTEEHHRHKVDSPSGTAISLANIVLEGFTRKERAVFDRLEGAPRAEDLHVSSLRCGSIPGTHSVIFDSAADTVTLTHQARSRHGFALGAVIAAEWIAGKKGLFSVDDMMREL